MPLELRAALRSIARSPGFLITAVLSLALGIGAAAAAFGVIDAVRVRAMPFPEADRLVIVSEVPSDSRGPCRLGCNVSYVTFAGVLQRHPLRTLDALEGYSSGGKALNTGDEPRLVIGGIVTPHLFALLGVRSAMGRGILPDDDRLGVPLVVVLSHDLWTSQYAQDPGVVGRTIKLSDSFYTVVGIMPAGFNHEVGSQFWLPMTPTLDPSTRPSIRSVTVIGRLAPGRTLEELRAELATIDPSALTPAGAAPADRIRLEAMPLRDR